MRRRSGSGAVRKLPSGRWQARITRPDGSRKSLGTWRTKTDAEQALVHAESEQLKGEWQPTPDDPGTVAEWAKKWLNQAHHLKPTTKTGHEQMLRCHVLPRFGEMPVTQIRREDVVSWVGEQVASGTKPDVIRLSMIALRCACKTAVTAGIIPANPVSEISLPRREQREMCPLTIEQVEALAEAISHPEIKQAGNGAHSTRKDYRPDLALAVRLAAYTGLRAGELWALRRKHLDLEARTIRVQESVAEVNGQLVFGTTKTGLSRAVTWPASLDEAINTHLSTRPDDINALVFVATNGSPVRHPGFMQRYFKPAVVRAGLPSSFRFHDLRHTHASLLIAMGAHPKAIQERLGHSSITVTLNTYGHLMPGMGDALAGALDKLITNSEGHVKGTNKGSNDGGTVIYHF